MKIDIQKLAETARLEIDADKVELYTAQMEEFISMADKLPDKHGSMSDPWGIGSMYLREDTPVPSLPREILLQEASQKSKDCFVVPKTVD